MGRLSARRAATSWRAARFAVVDLELTGLDPRRDEIVSWAVVPVEDGRIAVAQAVHGLVRPERARVEATAAVHGLLAGDVETAPSSSAGLAPLLDALRGRVLVAHAAWVELAFLGAALGPESPREAIDTARVAIAAGHAAWDEDPVGLDVLAGRLGLPAHAPHTADGDALTTAQVLLALATALEPPGEASVEALLRASRPRRRRSIRPGARRTRPR